MKKQFTEVLYNRIETKDANNNQKLTVSFERVRVVKEVYCTEAQANILNAGKTTHPGNAEFTLLLAEGEADPQPQILKVQIADKVDRSSDVRFSKPKLGDADPEFLNDFLNEFNNDKTSYHGK